MSTVIDDKQRVNVDRHQRWDHIRRAELLEQYRDLQSHGLSQRQAAKTLHVPQETARLAQQMPPKDITGTQDETCPGALCLVGMEPAREPLHSPGADGPDVIKTPGGR